MSDNKYWQNFGERKNSALHQQTANSEFREELPFEDNGNRLFNAITPRRDFLKYLGFSTAAAAIAASCEIPVKRTIPFANKPEDIVPGVANYYATTYVQDGDVVSVVAKVRDGRPIKIEGNDLSPLTKGGTTARVQASVLDLYDLARLRFPTIGNNEVTFETIDKEIATALSSLGTAPVVLLTSTITSPTTLQAIGQFLAKFPGSRHVVYDAVSHSGQLLANEISYGKKIIPSYHFENAKTIVSIGADFLGTWLSPVVFTKQYSKGKKIDEKNPQMSKHIHFESVLSLTGANADEKFLHRPSEEGAVVAALMNAVKGQAVTGLKDAKLIAGITKAAKLLNDSKGTALVVCGSNDPNVQVIVNDINEALQANGKTIDWNTPVNYRQGLDADFAKLVEDMNAGSIGALLVYSANPAYSWVDTKKFTDGLKKVGVTISFNPKDDETTQLCKYKIPDHHYLESWGDAEPVTGYFSLMQPTIYPLFKTRQWQDSLLKWSGSPMDYLSYIKQFWITKLGNETAWDQALQDGIINPAATTTTTDAPYNASGVTAALAAIGNLPVSQKTELQLYQKVGIGAGQGTSNPWLQEMPDPISKCTWDNYILISPAMAKSLLDIDLSNDQDTDAYEVHPAKPVLKLTTPDGRSISLPCLIIPGIHPDTVGIALGYGRTGKIGKAADGSGKDAYMFTALSGNTVSLNVPEVTVTATGDTFNLAVTQTHSIYTTFAGTRTDVMKELTLADFVKDPEETLNDREKELKPFGGLSNYEKQGTIYPYYDKPGIHWGMSVDLNTCTGCGACTVACAAENNVAIVGKSEVLRFHDMAWIRIDRYFSGDPENPKVVFQPLMCQQCDNAPCENVCPVSATNHSSEGLNQMIYNRCIGTKYCANNCPYKVRRFNWADYTGADSFPDNQDQTITGVLDPVVHVMNDDLTRMVINPDVTVRARGVMEKCTFCVQRLQAGKLKAKKESRPLKSGENNEWDVKTACQQACPADAIVFGNINDSKSAITQARAENHLRLFHSLEQLHTLPNVNYLVKVRNRDEAGEIA